MSAENSTLTPLTETKADQTDQAIVASEAAPTAAPIPAVTAKAKTGGFGGMLRKLGKAVGASADGKEKAETPAEAVEEEAPAFEGPEDVLKLLEALAENQAMLDDEQQQLKAGDLGEIDLFASRKRKAVAYLERLIARVEPLFFDLTEELQDEVRKRSTQFFETLEANIRLIEANRQAIGQILVETLKIIEKNGGDGIYSQAGQKLLSHQYSATGITAKL